MGALAAIGGANSALAVGGPVRFTLAVTAAATTDCTFTPALELVITSGHDRIWTSADCPVAAVGGPGVGAAPSLGGGTAEALLIPGGALLGRGVTASFDLVWPGVRSAGSCTAPTGALRPGTYLAAISLPGAGNTGTAFTLR